MYALGPAIAKPEMDPLERERKEIERRRSRYEDRKTRILHAKTRIIGIDTDALNEQIKEKQDREANAQQREQAYDELTLSHSRILTAAEQERAKEERRRAEELNFYRQQQSTEKRIKETIQRSISDPTDNNSMLLKFAGQDIDFSHRQRSQQQQQKEWLTQQIEITKEREQREREEDEAYSQTQAIITEQIGEQEINAKLARRQSSRELYEYNQAQAREKKEREWREKQQQHTQDQKELSEQLSSTFLNEATEDSALGSHRTIPYGFKGFSTSQRQQILDEQYRQQQDAHRRREQEKQESQGYAQDQAQIRRTALLLERERAHNEQVKRLALQDERKQQARDHSIRHQHLNSVVYTNPVSEEFFQQFGNSHR